MALHSNYEIRWQNFRGFEDTGWLVIRPLTILIGANNSGKTSVIAPLLLMTQTMASRDSVTPLVTRGPLMDAGGYKDIINQHDSSKKLTLGFRFHIHDDRPRLRKIGSYAPGSIQVTLKAGSHLGDIILDRSEISDLYRRPYLIEMLNDENQQYEVEFPSSSTLTVAEKNAVSGTQPVNFMFSPGAVFYALENEESDNEVITRQKYSRGFSEYVSIVGTTFEQLRYIFNNLTYVGPLRERLKRYYETSGEMPLSVGTQGEHMANMIRRRLSHFQKDLNTWIRRFEFGHRLQVRNLGEPLFSLLLTAPNRSATNVADIGFGASQVLPLIVQALAARRQSLTVAEQPEIHLNPRLQGTLADLFVQMANTDHRVIVETHSEHLLLRVRRLVASGEIESDQVAVYYVEKDDRGTSKVREIPIHRNGHIPAEDWPKGFFEETLRESLALAAEQSRVLAAAQ